MNKIKLAVAQFSALLLKVEDNFASACRLATTAAEQQVRLILFPEGCLTGNAISAKDKQATIRKDDPRFQQLQDIADNWQITICIGFAMEYHDLVNLVQAVIRPSQQPLFQHKSARVAGEPEFLVAWPDNRREIFSVDDMTVAIQICSEGGTPEVREQIEQIKPDILLYPSAGRLRQDELLNDDDEIEAEKLHLDYRCKLRQRHSDYRAQGMIQLIANPVGFDGENWWPGNSFIVDKNGDVGALLAGEHRPGHMSPAVCCCSIDSTGCCQR